MKTPLTIAVLACLATSVGAAGIQTIDCRGDLPHVAERTICRSQHLQILDAKITEVYAELMLSRRVAAETKTALRDSQYRFLDRRNACGASVDCLDEVMSLRASRINFYR